MSALKIPDLARFSVEVLATVANMGLVKRAQRELASGQFPELLQGPDGALLGRFADGVESLIPADAALDRSRCSCGAPGLCRHRIALILHARESAGGDQVGELAGPDRIDLAQLRAGLPKRCVDAAQRLRERGLVVELEFPSPATNIASARLSVATVRFLGGTDIALARCDCVQGGRCEHLLLAVEAFHEAASAQPGAAHARVEWRAATDRGVALGAEPAALLHSLCERGLQAGSTAHAQALSSALEAARALGATWLVLTLEAIEDGLLARDARSSLATPEAMLTLIAEVRARELAARGLGAISARAVLGLDEPMETALDRTRLVSLGCRVRDTGGRRDARVALLDVSSATLLALDSSAELSSVVALADRRIGGQLRLGALAQGQIVTTTLHRRANGQVRFGASWGGRVSLTPQNGDWSSLPASWIQPGLQSVLQRRKARAPALIAPRHLLDGLVVIACDAVEALAYDPVHQSVHAVLGCADGSTLRIERTHAQAAVGALDAIHAALDGLQAPFWVSGVLHFGAGDVHLDPWAIASPRGFCVPDLSAPTSSLAAAPIRPLPVSADAWVADLLQARGLLTEALIAGRRQLGAPWKQRMHECALRLERGFFSESAQAVRALLACVGDSDTGYAAAFAELALHLWLVLEAATLGPDEEAEADLQA